MFAREYWLPQECNQVDSSPFVYVCTMKLTELPVHLMRVGYCMRALKEEATFSCSLKSKHSHLPPQTVRSPACVFTLRSTCKKPSPPFFHGRFCSHRVVPGVKSSIISEKRSS